MTYKELCERLNVERDSNHKKQHLKQLQKKYKIEEKGKNDYELLGELSEVERFEVGSNYEGKNKLYLEPLIYTYLYNQPDNIIEEKLGKLLECFAMINKSYYVAKYNTLDVDKMLDTHSGVELFMKDSEPYLKHMLYKVLVDMEDKLLITLDYVPHACYRADKDNKYNKDVKISENRELYEQYLESYRISMLEKGYDKKSKIKWYDIMPIRKQTAKLLGCDYIYFAYRIVVNRIGLKDYILNDYYGVRGSHNKYIQNKIKNDKSRKTNKRYENIEDTELDTYLDYFVNINNEKDIKEELKEYKLSKKEKK